MFENLHRRDIFIQKLKKNFQGFPQKFFFPPNGLSSVRNAASPSENDSLKLLRYHWFENLSDKLSDNEFGEGFFSLIKSVK